MSRLQQLTQQKAYELLKSLESNYNAKQAEELLSYLNYQLATLQEQELASQVLDGEGVIKMLHFLEFRQTDRLHYMLDEFYESLEKTKDPYGPNFAAIHFLRGGGKTTNVRAKIVKSMLKYPLRKRLIISSNLPLAAAMLMPVRLIMEKDLRIRKYWGEQKGPIWNDSELLLAAAADMPNPDNSFSLEIGSPGSQKTGKHFDEIYIDDPISIDDMGDGSKVKDVLEAIDKAIPLLNPGGTMYFYGMRFGLGDIYDQAIYEHARAPLFKDRIFVAAPFLTTKEGQLINEKGEPISEDSPEKIPLYPTRFPAFSLERTRLAVGPAMWYAQYMNFPKPAQDKLMDYSKLSQLSLEEWNKIMLDVRFSIIPRNQLRLIVDTTNSANKKSNMTSVELWHYDKTTFKLLFFRKMRFDFDHTTQYLAELAREFRMKTIHVEKSGVYDSISNTVPLLSSKLGYPVTIEPLSHHGVNKNIRIGSMQPFLNQSLILIAPEGTMMFPITMNKNDEKFSMHELLKKEMKIFPSDQQNPPDDLLDGFGHVPGAYGFESDFFDMRLLKGESSEDEDIQGVHYEEDGMEGIMTRALERADANSDEEKKDFVEYI